MSFESVIFSIMGVGAIFLTVGAGLAWGWPASLAAVGAMLMFGPWFLLMMNS